jgi:hypothetical protein
VQKAILAQAKLGELDDLPSSERERLVGQIVEMRRFTRSPKVILIRELGDTREPLVASGLGSRGIYTPRLCRSRIISLGDCSQLWTMTHAQGSWPLCRRAVSNSCEFLRAFGPRNKSTF